MPMNDDDFMSVFTGRAKVAKQNYPVIPVMGTDTSYIDAKEDKQKEMAQNNAIDFSFLDDDSLGLGEKLQKFWRVQTNTQTPDERLESAEKVGNALGLVPQTLVENDDLYKNALLTYQSQKNNAYLQGQDFAPKTVAELYPELDTEDTVATTLALRDYNNVLKTREAISQGVPTYALGTDDSLWGAYKAGAIEGANLPGYLFEKIADFATKAYDAGQALDKQSELMYHASTGEISDEEAEKELKGLVNAGKELDTAIGDSYVAKIVGETISQLSMQKNMMLRGIEKIMAPITPLAQPVLQATKTNLPQLATLGTASAMGVVGATGTAAGATVAGAAALAGAVTLGTAAVFVGTYRAEAGQAYWDWRTKRNKNGQRTYTREQAISHAKRVGVMNAAIEAGAWELAFKGIAKVYGKEAATAVIKDTEAMKKMIGAGRKAIKLQSLKYGAKQFAKVAIPETVEEGLQSLTADIDTNLFGEGGISKKEMFNNALDAMIQAVPSVIGMSAGGSLVGGVGAYRAMKKISGLSEMEEACMEFKRTNEKTMLEKIMELRKESSLFQKAPEAYRKTIQKQMDQSGMGTVYIDAQTAAESEATHEALNEMVEKGIVSAKELDESIKTGKPLTVESGKYLQLASETTPETLADYTTMDKGERTLHAIKEERERLKNLISLVTGTKEKREKAAVEKILNEHFSEDTEKGREDRATAQELLSGGLDNLQENYKSLLKEAKETWGKLSGVKELQDYMERRKTQDAYMSNEKGVDFVDTGEGPDRVHTRESKNPDWYQDFYGDNDRAPNQRELYDIAHEKTIRENDKGDDASKVGIQELEAAKAKVESLERVGEVIKALDKEDLVAQTLLDPDTYEEAYKPLLEQLGKGNAAVTKAARDSALVLAKLAENFHKNYGVPLKLATMEIMKENPLRIKDIKKEEQSVSRDRAESRRSWGPALPYINILHQFLRGSNIRNALPSKTEVREISENASRVIKENVAELKPADFTPSTFKRELYTELSKGTAEDILANTIKLLKSYSDIDIYDPLGNKIHFAPPDGESIEQYATHLIAGHEEKLDETSRARALGIRLALETIKNPMAIILQENGRKQYLSLYSDGTNRLHQIVVGVQEDEKGRIITSFMKDAKRKDKNAPFARFKKQIATSKKVLYIRGLDNRQGRSEHSRPQADQWVSKLSAKLHPFGNSIISQEELENNESFHQMAGEFAETAPLDKLKHAEQMEIEGAEPEEIWKQTGWVRGPEGLWRFEIPDNLDNMHLDRLSEDFCYLDEIYDNPELYQAYPELADTKIKVEDFSKAYEGKYANAGGMTDNGVIVLSKEYLSHTPDEKVKKIILHELQHIIQDTVEPGFSKGGNKAVAKKQMENTLHTLELELKNKARVFESVKKYLSAHEKLAKAFDEGDFKTAFAAMDEKKEAGTKLKIADKQYLDRRLEQIAYIKEALKGGDYVAYRRLGGEAEAFMVMDRANNNKGEFPNYDTGYGAPVANFGGISHSFMAAREMNDRADSLVAFKKLLYEDMEKGWAANSEKWTDRNGITYKGERLVHAIRKHEIIEEQWEDIEKHIGNLHDVSISNEKKPGQFNGIHIIARIEGKLSSYRVNLDFLPNGKIQFETVFPGEKKSIQKEIANHASQVLTSDITVGGPLGRGSAISVSNIQKELGIVKKENTGYHQRNTDNNKGEFPNYDTGYGAPVANFGGISHSLMAAREMNDRADSLVAFKKLLYEDMKKGWAASSEKWTSQSGVTYNGERITHVIKKHHLTDEQLADIDKNINKLTHVAVSKYKGKGQFGGVHVIGLLEGDVSTYRINLDFLSNGMVKFDTAFTGSKEGIIKDIESHTAQVLPVKAVATDSLGRALSMSIPTIQKELGVVKEENTGYYQTAYHGSPYKFNTFDLGAVGNGEGNQVHGWGLYFTKDKTIAATRYRDRLLKWLRKKGKLTDNDKGTVFEVEVPEDNVLLDEDKPVNEQPLAVRKAIAEYYKSRPDDYITPDENDLDYRDIGNQTGERFYKDVVFQMRREGQEHPQKAASELLNSFGIKGITYDGRMDGRCFVVFDDQAISIIEKYNQAVNGSQYQGSYNPTSNVIEIFDGANQSTAIHEGAHMFLTSLEKLAEMPEEELLQAFNGDERAAKASRKKVLADLQTIRNWASFSEKHLEEYKGTSLEKEFNAHAEAIRRGDANAEEIWMQERFARGFEKYLMDGSAPTKELRGVFRRFKSWLTDIYKAAKNLGNVELTPEIKDVFDKMLATENEINAWAAQRKLESIDKAINVDKSELDNLKEWAENVKQKALEKAMSYYLHMVKEDAIEQFKNSISSEEARKDFMQKLGEENELYKIEQIYNSPTFPTQKEREDFLKSNGIASEKELKKKLQDSGGTSEERWNKNISDMVQSYKDEALTPEAIQAMAEEILNSPEGLERKAKIETMLLEKKVTQYINLVTSMQLELKRSKNKAKTAREIRKRLGLATEKETAELEKQSATIAKSEEKITKLEKQVKELREKLKATKETAKEENKSRKESAEILEGNLKAIQQELEKERAAHAKLQETNDDTNLTVAELSAKLKAIKEGWVESRTAMRFNMQLIKEDARNTLGEETLSHATSWRWWQAKASAAETKAMKAAAENDWNQAAYWKQVQGQDLIMAKQARANEDEIRHTLYGGGGKLTTAMLNENGMEKYGILGIINRIGRSENPVLMKDDARYFVQHLAYVLGMTKTDGRLPIDKNGMEREFSWKWLAVEMNPMIAMENPNYKAEDIIPDWIRAAFNGNQPMKMKDLTMNQFREMTKVMKAVYRLGRREYEGNTLGTSFDNASEEISNEIMKKWEKSGHRVTTPQIKVVTATEKDRKKTRFHDLVRSITLPEILIERMGKKAYQYIYQPIDKATAKRRELKAEARKTFQENFKMYTVKEWAVMRNKRIYKYGIDENGKPAAWTKEEVLCMALNFGTQSNRDRLIESLWGNEEQLMNFLDSVLDDRDWTFVEKVWAHENSYWGARNKIQNDLYGIPLGKVKGLNFYNKDGRLIHGQYYRIKYDPKTSSKTGHLAKDNIARMDMENMSAFSLGMGSTKKRALTSGGQKLRFDLDVYTESVQEAIQHVAMREATVDVYKLLNQKDVIAAIETTMGVNTLGELQNWVKDNWHSSIRDMCEWDTFFAQCRRKFTFATMGFRFSTALLNLCNIFGMMERIGAGNALKAVGDFYFKGGMKEKWNFITAKSSMMKERAATMDRDTYIGDDMPVKRHESKLRSKIEHGKFGTDSINSKAYALIAYTDMLFSCPEWLHIYQRTMVELEQEGQLSREEMDQEAVRLADKAVRETFGSGETKDQTEFIRKNNALAQATAFFSYTNLVTNQFIRAGYIKYDTGNIKPLLKATWYWWILGSLLETVLRVWGDDSDDEDKWKNKFAHVLASSGPTGGIPAFRDAIPWAVDLFVAGKSPGDMAPNLSALDSFGYAQKTLTSLGKGDLVEAGRATSKLFTRTTIPVPDTLTDAFWNFIRLIGTDNNYTITDYLWKSLWDRPLKQEQKKGKKKE